MASPASMDKTLGYSYLINNQYPPSAYVIPKVHRISRSTVLPITPERTNTATKANSAQKAISKSRISILY
ncbi:hypothetical protein GCM10028895_37270 [Pontibacter rugosus]